MNYIMCFFINNIFKKYMKKNVFLIIAIIVIGVIGYIVWQNKPTNNIQSQQNTSPEKPMANLDNQPQASLDSTAQDQGTAPTETAKPSTSTYSMSEVSSHNNPADCWAVVDNNVYNLTNAISKHPGGERAIIGLCGTDGTAAFSKQHGSNEKAKAVLASFMIGTLAN